MPATFESTRVAAVAGLALLLLCASAQAGTTMVSGQFTQDDELTLFEFDLVAGDTLTATSFSYGGSPAHAVAAGGFAPVLSLFQDGVGLLQIARGSSSVCGAPGTGVADPTSGFCWDAQLTLAGVGAGHYQLVLSQDGNEPLGQFLADGYSQQGVPDYTSIYNGVPGSTFIEVTGQQRSGHYALEIAAPLSPAVPEPASVLMLLAGLGGLAGVTAARRCRPS